MKSILKTIKLDYAKNNSIQNNKHLFLNLNLKGKLKNNHLLYTGKQTSIERKLFLESNFKDLDLKIQNTLVTNVCLKLVFCTKYSK